MADNRKYYYLKLKEDFFDTDEMKILESMKDGYLYSNILLKLYLKSLSNSGRLMYRNVIPYTPEILATLTGHQVGTVEKALDVFKKLDLIEMLDNGAIYMMDIQNFIGQSSSEADRQREYYKRMKAEKEALAGENTETPELPEPKEPVLPAEQKSNKAIGNYTTDFEELWEACLRDVILLPEGGTPYCFTWARTDAFTMGEDAGKAGVVIGCEVRFDILEYPSMETSDPDPVMAVDKYIKELYPECLVMGYDRMEEITEASADQPVVYCRLISSEKQEETNTVAWMDGRIAVHVLCPENTVRLKMAADIANHLSFDGEVIMLDYSPMFIKRLQVNYKSDYLKEGQVFITGHYGLLRYKAKPHVLVAAHGNYS